MNSNPTIEKSQTYLLNNYGRLPISMSLGQGSEIWDSGNKRYLDFFAGFGACGVSGHCDPRITEVIKQQASQLLCHGNFFSSEPQVNLAEKIVEHSFLGKVFFCHSGAEANEAAIKLVRKAGGKDRYKIICFENSFHGRTLGALSITPPSFQTGFEPMLDGALRAPFGDIEAVKNLLDEHTAAIFLEPIQGEGGINIPSIEFMQQLRALCDERQLLLVCDEVWTAPARTGRWFAHQHFDITPDIMTMAKAIGGGAPLAAMLVADKWADVLGPGTHGCTMGGNPLCAAVALRSAQLIEEDSLCERAEVLGSAAKEALTASLPACVTNVRGKGIMLALELDSTLAPMDIVKECLAEGLCIAPGKNNTIRIAPALNISMEMLSEGIDILLKVLKNPK